MPYDLSNYLVIGVSSRALFDLNRENEIYENQGLEAYCRYQLEHENDVLKPGTGFALIEAMLRVNTIETGVRRTEVVIISRNSADTSLRTTVATIHATRIKTPPASRLGTKSRKRSIMLSSGRETSGSLSTWKNTTRVNASMRK